MRTIEYKTRCIEKKPLARTIMVHTAMHYKCEKCGKVFQFWLEKGLEDSKQDEINPLNHKPVPFCIGCLCGGIAQHFAWGSDMHLDDYRPLKEDENYFKNAENEDCGVSHFRNFGNSEFHNSKLKELVNSFETTLTSEPREDDPYGLAYVSTTVLKKELRRRKRWK